MKKGHTQTRLQYIDHEVLRMLLFRRASNLVELAEVWLLGEHEAQVGHVLAHLAVAAARRQSGVRGAQQQR